MVEKSRQEAKDWVSKAIAYYKASGKEAALTEFSKPKGQFVQGELYIFVLNLKGVMVARGINDKYIGKSFLDVKDSTGKSFAREILNTADAEGSGWIDYQWYNQITKEIKTKSVYFEKVDDLIICSGIYLEGMTHFITMTVNIPGSWTG